MVAASTSSGELSTNTCRKPSRFSPRSDRRSCSACRCTTWGPKRPVGASLVACQAQSLRHIQHDGNRQAVMFPGESHQGLAVLGLYAGGVNYGEASGPQPRGRDEVEAGQRHRVLRPGRWRHPPPSPGRRPKDTTSVGMKWLAAKEDFPDPVGPMSATRHSFRNGNLHWVKTPIWVGEPYAGCSGPMSWKRTSYFRRSATCLAQVWNCPRVHSNRWSR